MVRRSPSYTRTDTRFPYTPRFRSPLAQALFQVDGVTGVFLGYDFISVSKRDGKECYLMKPGVLGVIMEQFVAGRPTILDSTVPDAGAEARKSTRLNSSH